MGHKSLELYLTHSLLLDLAQNISTESLYECLSHGYYHSFQLLRNFKIMLPSEAMDSAFSILTVYRAVY